MRLSLIAVQCERKPVEVSREKPANCAPSIEKIYIRKNLCSPLAAMPTFVNEKETARYIWDQNSCFSPNRKLNCNETTSKKYLPLPLDAQYCSTTPIFVCFCFQVCQSAGY